MNGNLFWAFSLAVLLKIAAMSFSICSRWVKLWRLGQITKSHWMGSPKNWLQLTKTENPVKIVTDLRKWVMKYPWIFYHFKSQSSKLTTDKKAWKSNCQWSCHLFLPVANLLLLALHPKLLPFCLDEIGISFLADENLHSSKLKLLQVNLGVLFESWAAGELNS